ncbi:MAG: hypothetical protein ACK44D_13025 [Bacteroidia bacterium]
MTRFFTGAKILQQTPLKIFIDEMEEFVGKRNLKGVRGEFVFKNTNFTLVMLMNIAQKPSSL